MFRNLLIHIFLSISVLFFAVSCEDANPTGESPLDGLVVSGNDETIAIIEVESHDDHAEEEHCDELGQTDCESADHCEWHEDEGACEDDDHDHGNGGHSDADGFILEDENSTEIYRQFQGTITGEISISASQAPTELSVHFLDNNEQEIEGESEMAIHLEGVSAGSTSFIMELWHDGHVDYTSLSINVTVIE